MNYLKDIKTIEDFELKDKVVFIRLDLNVPIKGTQITDETRITKSLPTIQYAISKGAKVVLGSHLGRPKGDGPEDRKKYSLEPVAKRLSELLNMEVHLLDYPWDDSIKLLTQSMRNKVFLLENLRFDPGEKVGAHSTASSIASFAEIYINDAFGASHREDSSIVATPELMTQKGIGLLMMSEIKFLSHILEKPDRPFYAILGGAKVSDKIELIENLINQVDGFIIGGAMAYTFLKSQEIHVGKSLVEDDKLNVARQLKDRLLERGKKLLLPVDHIVTQNLKQPENFKITDGLNIEDDWMGVDIGPKTIELFAQTLTDAKTIFWNGPMGVFEQQNFNKGTFAIANAISNTNCISVVGGGDSVSAINQSGVSDKITHISTGGGASLEFLQGTIIPGLRVLINKKRIV